MNKNKAFTILELILSLALFALVMIMILSLLDYAMSSITKTERAAEATSNSSVTKDLLVKYLTPSTSIEILKPISTNDLTEYIDNLDTGDKYTYLYSIDGVVYYRNSGKNTTGKEVKVTATTNVDFEFTKSSTSDKTLDINMIFRTKEVDPYVLEEMLHITPLNFAATETIIDNRTDKAVPSNIIRFVSDEIVMEEDIVVDDTPQIISATVYNIPVKNSPKGKYDIPFYVSQTPRVIQLYNYSSLADKGEKIIPQTTIDTLWDYEQSDAYFNNIVIGQSTFVTNNNPTTHEVSFVYKGHTFIDINGNEHIGELNQDGTRTVKYKIPVYETTNQMQFGVKSESGAYVAYDFIVNSQRPKPEIVRFEFLPEDNYQEIEQKNNITYRLKTYINQSDVYYSKENKTQWDPIRDTVGASRPASFNTLNFGSQRMDSPYSLYSTIVMPTNRTRESGDFYPNLLDKAANGSDKNKYLASRVATITFKGTSIHDPDGNRITVPETEWSKLNGIEEVTVKVSIDGNFKGAVDMLDGKKYSDVYAGTKYENYTYEAYAGSSGTTEWFDPKNDVVELWNSGKGYVFTVVNGTEIKRYTYQHEASTTKPDYHKGTNADSGLNRVWVEGYMDGAWVGGSMRDDVSGDVVVKVPYDKYDSIKYNVTLKTSAYGEELIQLPSYVATSSTDNYSYYDLDSANKKEVTIPGVGAGVYPGIRYNAGYLKHFVLVQKYREYSPIVRYQVKIEKSYPKDTLEPTVESIKVLNASIKPELEKTYIRNDGTFAPHSDMYGVYNVGSKVNLDIAFAGSKITVGKSIDPNSCTEYKNGLATKDTLYVATVTNLDFGVEYYIHLFDYSGELQQTYKIMPNTKKNMSTRSTTVYDLSKEMARTITYSPWVWEYYILPFLPVKTEVPGVSYGYHTDNTNANLRETPISMTYFGNDANAPVPYNGGGAFDIAYILNYATKNLNDYTISSDGKSLTKRRMFIRSTRTDYSVGGNNVNTASQYNITNFMTPVLINQKHLMYVGAAGVKFISPEAYNTDNWVGPTVNAKILERRPFVASNVKLDTTGFSVQIFNDRVFRQKTGGTEVARTTGRPGTVTETNYDIALVDTTTDSFNTESYAPDTTNNTNTDYTYSLPHDNSPIPTTIKTNDVLSYGFSLIEQEIDRDPKQDYLGTVPTSSTELNNATPKVDDRKVALMFYTRNFFSGGTGMDLAKAPANYVKIADLTGFEMESTSGTDSLKSQAVNFVVDVKTTFNGTTTITDKNYESIMKNNYIAFTVTELDIEGKPTGVVHFKAYKFADVFGSIRVDDLVNSTYGYNELNLLLTHRSRVIKNADGTLNTTARPVRLSVGYGTNWGLVGISDFKIMR